MGGDDEAGGKTDMVSCVVGDGERSRGRRGVQMEGEEGIKGEVAVAAEEIETEMRVRVGLGQGARGLTWGLRCHVRRGPTRLTRWIHAVIPANPN